MCVQLLEHTNEFQRQQSRPWIRQWGRGYGKVPEETMSAMGEIQIPTYLPSLVSYVVKGLQAYAMESRVQIIWCRTSTPQLPTSSSARSGQSVLSTSGKA